MSGYREEDLRSIHLSGCVAYESVKASWILHNARNSRSGNSYSCRQIEQHRVLCPQRPSACPFGIPGQRAHRHSGSRRSVGEMSVIAISRHQPFVVAEEDSRLMVMDEDILLVPGPVVPCRGLQSSFHPDESVCAGPMPSSAKTSNLKNSIIAMDPSMP